ncbi:alpha-amylase family glycosyl hydrolase [Lacinutrix sp.]|jgi:glycosidase|uniref:alpha-amylase family glycosyl hydrolase n=1 Tax=Lacinutrix sp. TaxID=1937692 RepID=UPI0026303760|nr:alpha-amylase family glycosyl hydrolase [Lacinutrix sp.]MDG1714830.1 alpha-amylase family glycosyl hydrolase [Lacinutrix sp.]
MKKLIALVFLITIIACKKEVKQTEANSVLEEQTELKPISAKDLETAIIYEANIRQYSKEGTFKQFTKDIPQLKQLGVKVIWLMPVFPISQTKRKATGGDFASKIEDPKERAKALGSYYAVSDFKKINPEFGTIEDFRSLLKTAHKNGMYVILDWVPNHTGWDHTWLKTNPEFYTKNAIGEITDPLNDDGTSVGWADVADLNYDSEGLRKAMIEDMLYWITEEGIDGFRCDVAGSVPTDFWQETIPQLRAKKDIFMLAEAWEPELMKGDLFDMAYGWDRHHTMNHIAKGEKDATAWTATTQKDAERYEADDILMNFITNHDENSWNGTVKERMGDAAEAMLALSYVAPGMPLIYSGQEYDMSHRLKFFEKDEIIRKKGKTWPILEKLGKLKNTSSALHVGKNAAKYKQLLNNNKNVLTFERHKNGVYVTYIANLSNKEQTLNVPTVGEFIDYMKNEKLEYKDGEIVTLKPWEYKILID